MTDKIEKGSKTYNIISSLIYIAIGVLFILAIIDVNTLLGYFIGGSLILAGIIVAVVDLVNLRFLRNITVAVSSVAIGFGIAMMLWSLPFEQYLSLAVLVFGAMLIVNGIIYVVRKATVLGLVMLILGAIALTFGILFFTVDGFRGYCTLIFGIVLVIFGVIYLIEAISGKKIISR